VLAPCSLNGGGLCRLLRGQGASTRFSQRWRLLRGQGASTLFSQRWGIIPTVEGTRAFLTPFKGILKAFPVHCKLMFKAFQSILKECSMYFSGNSNTFPTHFTHILKAFQRLFNSIPKVFKRNTQGILKAL